MTRYELFKFLHVVGAIAWVGGGIGLTILARRLVVARDHAARQSISAQGKALGNWLFMPAFNRKVESILPEYDLEGFARAVGAEFLALRVDAEVDDVIERAASAAREECPVLVDVAIDYGRRTHFTRGVVRSVFGRLPLAQRMRFLGRAVSRRITS